MTSKSDGTVRVGVIDVPGSRKVVKTLEVLGAIHVVGLRYYQDVKLIQVPEDTPPTVKGNSRQKLVEGKRHTWPATKKRKGDR